ncbi:hypothetical protein HYC85_032325 [Camellia sinensis]|uniref:Clathrin/coatomer adaptor adaptin-like N-terminal domain-containing protein n=1 Tax=Camellia sinensis TaxID=4442 RepID=A0A7J7FT00_CAMSI|nr:hypothetical protein HYC85_032325 [Camellia sinensis]
MLGKPQFSIGFRWVKLSPQFQVVKAREYLDKPAVHETMVKVSAYILGEYSHLLARRPGCSPKEIFSIIHEKLPTVSEGRLNFCFLELVVHALSQNALKFFYTVLPFFLSRYESCIDVEIQQRVVEYFALSRKGADLVDILAEMPKFPERQSALIRKGEDTEADTAEQSATKLRSLHQTSNALVMTDQRPANGMPPVNQLGLVKVPNMSNVVRHSLNVHFVVVAQNNWKRVWWHSSLTTHLGFLEEDSPYTLKGQKGTSQASIGIRIEVTIKERHPHGSKVSQVSSILPVFSK